MATTLESLLDEVEPSRVDGHVIDALRAELDGRARWAVEPVAEADRPLRLTKERIARVLQCEHLAVAVGADRELSEPVVRGHVLDRLLHHHVHGAATSAGTPALAVAEGAFEAERADDVTSWLDEHRDERQRLAEDATAFAAGLAALGRPSARWWPRCEEVVRVDLADGDVTCRAQLDLALGGSATELPLVIVEVKSGRFTAEHRDGLWWYALLAAMRHSIAPAAVVGWSALDERAWFEPVSDGALRAAGERAGAALERIGEIVRGRTPERIACRACAWCVERETCPAARSTEDDDDLL